MFEGTVHDQAVELAKRELDELYVRLQELHEINAKIHILECFLKQSPAQPPNPAGMPEQVKSEPSMSTVAPKPKRHKLIVKQEMPYHERAQQIMQELGPRMKLGDILDEFEKREWPVNGTNPREVLRACLWRKKDLFRNCGEGVFELVREKEPEKEIQDF